MTHRVWITDGKVWNPIDLCDEGHRLFVESATHTAWGIELKGRGKKRVDAHRETCQVCNKEASE